MGCAARLEAISSELAQAWQVVRPEEATVEFALGVKVKEESKLTGLLVSGGAEGSLKVTLKWRNGGDSGGARG